MAGAVGATGPEGTVGLTGATGLTGNTGNTGATGVIGNTGLTGATGIQGNVGNTGATGVAGANGTNGVDGATGPQGNVGITGATGVAGANGTNGTNGVAGATGLQGIVGNTGATGVTGNTGGVGATGVGTTGATGVTGAQGATGPSGSGGGSGSVDVYEFATTANFPATGAAAVIYIATDASRIYRWAGTAYMELGPLVGSVDTTLRNLLAPPAPTGITVAANNAQVIVTWTAPTGVLAQAPITDYTVQYSINSGSSWTTFTRAASTATSATVTGLTNGTAYVFRVAGVNGVGTGSYSTVSSSVTPATGDAFWSNVAVLLSMDGSEATFIDNSSTPQTITVGGGATQSIAQSKFGGKSAFFNSTTDHLTFADVALGTGDFAVELWFNTSSSVQYAQLFGNEGPGGSTGFSVLINNNSATGGQIALYARGGIVVSSSAGVDLSDGAWHYLAVSKSGTTVRLYIDGNLSGTGNDAGSYSGGNWYLARNNVFSPRNVVGYIDDFRLTKGSARGYTGATIPVPTAAFPTVGPSGVATDGYFSNVSLLLHGDGNLTDSSAYAKTLSTIGTVSTAGAGKYGSASFSFSGSGRLVVPSDASTTFDGDFTIECLVQFSAKPSNYIALFAGSSGATQMFLTTKVSGNGLRWGLSAVAEYAAGDFTWALGIWYHVAVRRSSSAVTLWVDGVNITSGTPADSTTYSGGFNLFGGIGSVTDFSGLVDEFRITKNVARAIIVPAAAFPNSGN